jgi:GTP-binding protein EngB required for normal cell division
MPSIELSLVDCPGYGYANRSLSERKKWDLMMNLYFGSSKKYSCF